MPLVNSKYFISTFFLIMRFMTNVRICNNPCTYIHAPMVLSLVSNESSSSML